MQYQIGSITPSGRQLQYRMVEEAVQLIVQALATVGAPDPCLTNQGELDIWIQFQYQGYSYQDPLPNRVKPIPLQVIHHISSIATASGDPS